MALYRPECVLFTMWYISLTSPSLIAHHLVKPLLYFALKWTMKVKTRQEEPKQWVYVLVQTYLSLASVSPVRMCVFEWFMCMLWNLLLDKCCTFALICYEVFCAYVFGISQLLKWNILFIWRKGNKDKPYHNIID